MGAMRTNSDFGTSGHASQARERSSARSSAARSREAPCGRPEQRASHVTNSVALMSGGRQSCSGMYPTRRRIAARSRTTSCPSSVAEPLDGSTSPSKILTSVLLPAPFAPTNPVIPDSIDTVSASSAMTLSYRRVSDAVSMMAMTTPAMRGRRPLDLTLRARRRRRRAWGDLLQPSQRDAPGFHDRPARE